MLPPSCQRAPAFGSGQRAVISELSRLWLILQMGKRARRIFLTICDKPFQIFLIIQSKDGSFYITCTDDQSVQGKVSIHSTGQSHYKFYAGQDSARFIVQGNPLLDVQSKSQTIRHLFTAMIKLPTFIPSAPFGSRSDDVNIDLNSTEVSSIVFMFFAVPISDDADDNVKIQFDCDGTIPLGADKIAMKYHDIWWVAYEIIDSPLFPAQTQIYYSDGFEVPFPRYSELKDVNTKRIESSLSIARPRYYVDEDNIPVLSIAEIAPGEQPNRSH